MSRLALAERARLVGTTALVTAVLTSVGWIVFGGGIAGNLGDLAVLRTTDASAVNAPAAGNPRSGRPNPAQAAGQASAAKRVPVREFTPIVAGYYAIPVAGVSPSQLFDSFTQPREGGARLHEAIDIMAPLGTPVLAAVEGSVERLFTSRYGGLTIYVRSPDRQTITYYAHLDAYSQGLAEGQRVRRGQQLGTVGFTGNADPAAPHLHFAIMRTGADSEWWEPSTAVNPYPVLTGRGG